MLTYCSLHRHVVWFKSNGVVATEVKVNKGLAMKATGATAEYNKFLNKGWYDTGDVTGKGTGFPVSR